MTFERAAYVFAPGDGAAIVDVGRTWRRPDAGPPVVWGALSRLGTDARWAARREQALARAKGRVTRLPASVMREGGLRTALGRWLRGGAIVEHGTALGTRRIDVVAEAAGVGMVGKDTGIAVATGGGVVLLHDSSVVRAGQAGTAADPSVERDALRAMAGRGIPVPRLVDAGVIAGVSWCAEERLPGDRPDRIRRPLLVRVVEELARFPHGTTPGAAFARDVDVACEALAPPQADAVRELAAAHAPALEALPAVARHGDFWAGNLLVDGAQLTGIVDWDAFDADGVPGADLLQLIASEMRLDARMPLGSTFLGRPQHDERFTNEARGYWSAMSMASPDDEQLDAIAVAWWITEVASSLRRRPLLADDDAWVRANVTDVVARARRA